MSSRLAIGLAALTTLACTGVCCSGGILTATHDAVTESPGELAKKVADRGLSDKAIRDAAMQGECKMVTAKVEDCIAKYKEKHGGDLAENKAAAESTEPKAVAYESLWTVSSQEGYLENEAGRMEGTFKGDNSPTGIFLGTLNAAGTEVKGQFKYTKKESGTPPETTFSIKPYGASNITWPEGRTLNLNFQETEAGVINYSLPATYTDTSGKKVQLNTYSNASGSNADGWYVWVPGRSSEQSCTPLVDQYRLNPTDYSLTIKQRETNATRSDCNVAAQK